MATDAFLKLDDIKGESVDVTHKGEIEIVHWEWGVAQGGTAHSGSGAGAGKVAFQDLTLRKYSDISSPNLIKMCCSGKHFKSAVLTIRKAGGGKPLEYVKIRLNDGIVSGFRVEGRVAGDRLAETVRLNFVSYVYEYTPQAPNGAPMGTIPASWNIATNALS